MEHDPQQLHSCHNSLKLENLRLPLCYYIDTYYNIVYIHTSFHKFPNILGQKYVKTSRLFYGVDPERLEEKRDFSTDFFFTRHKYELCICTILYVLYIGAKYNYIHSLLHNFYYTFCMDSFQKIKMASAGRRGGK